MGRGWALPHPTPIARPSPTDTGSIPGAAQEPHRNGHRTTLLPPYGAGRGAIRPFRPGTLGSPGPVGTPPTLPARPPTRAQEDPS